MSVRIEDIQPGARIVTGRRLYCVGRDLAGAVSEFDVTTIQIDEEGMYFLNRAGVARRFKKNADPYSSQPIIMPGDIVWTVPIPQATDEELRRLVTAVVGFHPRHSRDRPWLLHVQTTAEGVAYALPVLPAGDDRNRNSIHPSNEPSPHYRVGNAMIWPHMVRIRRETDDYALRPGALVVFWPAPAQMVDGLPLHEARHLLDVMTCSVEWLGAWLPQNLSTGGFYVGPFEDLAEIEDEEERARLRTQPNEALVLGYVDDAAPGSLLLGTTGITFHNVDDILENMLGGDDADPGLWVAEDATWAGSGEDVEIESNMRPATMADLERFGWDARSLRAEIAGNFDVPLHAVPEDACEQLLAQTMDLDAVRDWETARRAPWEAVLKQLQDRSGKMSHEVRYPMADFLREASRLLLSCKGMTTSFSAEEATIRWEVASMSIHADGRIRVVVPEGTHDHEPKTRRDRDRAFEVLIRWLTDRPENMEGGRPDDPRTVVLVRGED